MRRRRSAQCCERRGRLRPGETSKPVVALNIAHLEGCLGQLTLDPRVARRLHGPPREPRASFTSSARRSFASSSVRFRHPRVRLALNAAIVDALPSDLAEHGDANVDKAACELDLTNECGEIERAGRGAPRAGAFEHAAHGALHAGLAFPRRLTGLAGDPASRGDAPSRSSGSRSLAGAGPDSGEVALPGALD